MCKQSSAYAYFKNTKSKFRSVTFCFLVINTDTAAVCNVYAAHQFKTEND